MPHREQPLLDAVERILRAPEGRLVGWVLVIAHLSALPPPGARPHHRRAALAVMEDAAAKTNGHLYPLPNGDLGLLFRPGDGGTGLVALLGRLFGAEWPGAHGLASVWSLPQEGAAAAGHIRSVTPHVAPSPAPEAAVKPAVLAVVEAGLQSAALPDVLNRQTAVLLRPGRDARIQPLFREIALSGAVIEARMAVSGQVAADPQLLHYLAARLDYRILGAFKRDVAGEDALAGGDALMVGLHGMALHLNLSLAGILSASFAAFAAACQTAIAAGLAIGVEVPFIEAFADIKGFILARERLRLAGMRLVLDGVTGPMLAVTCPAPLDPFLVKLAWTAGLPETGPALQEAIGRLGPDRIVLLAAESERAVTWGLSCGIQRFQGRYIDAMLAANRLQACAFHAACTLRQCAERATATSKAGRSACQNPVLLDHAAAPAPTLAMAV